MTSEAAAELRDKMIELKKKLQEMDEEESGASRKKQTARK